MTTKPQPGPYLEIHPTAVLIFSTSQPSSSDHNLVYGCTCLSPHFRTKDVYMRHDGPRNWGPGKSLMSAH